MPHPNLQADLELDREIDRLLGLAGTPERMDRTPDEGGWIDAPGVPHANAHFPSAGLARKAALRHAASLGPGHSVAHDPRPARGLPHYHVVNPAGARVPGHFFYGSRLPYKQTRAAVARRPRRRALREHEAEAPAPASGRFLGCNAAELAKVNAIVGKTLTEEDVRKIIRAIVVRALKLCKDAAAALRASPRAAATKKTFCRCFSVPPENVPAWRSGLKGKVNWKDLGELVAIRLENAAKILGGGFMSFFCWGSAARCPECTDSPNTYIACSSWGKRYVICLGKTFWQNWTKGEYSDMATTLLHEALHIYFSTTVAHSGRTGNASCYQRFVLDSAGLAIPARLVTRCPAASCT